MPTPETIQLLCVLARQYGTQTPEGDYVLKVDETLFMSIPPSAMLERTQDLASNETIFKLTMPRLHS